MAGSKTSNEPEDTGPEETWLRRADGEQAVRLRVLNAFIAKGGSVTEARLIEGEDGIWSIRVRLSGRKGEFVVNKFDSDAPRAYKDVALAIHSVYADMGYRGAIIVSSERDYTAES